MGAITRREVARRRSVRLGFLVVLAMVLALVFAVTAQSGLPGYLPGVHRTSISAVFASAEALRSGDDVRIANVRVGFVDSIRREDGRAVVELRLDNGRPVYRDATAKIGARSALGQKFVELAPGTEKAGELPENGVLTEDRTTSPVELDTALDALDARTLAATRSLLRETGGGIGGHGQDVNDGLAALPDLVENLGKVSSALSKKDGTDTGRLLVATDQLASTLSTQEDHLATLVDGLAETLEAIGTDDGEPLEDTLESAPDTLVRVRAALKSLDEPLARTESATKALKPGAEALSAATPDLRRLLRDGVEPLDKVPGVAELAVPAVEDLTTTLDGATPLVDQLSTALQRAQRPLRVIAPYSPEVMLFFRNASDALKYGDESGNWLRFYVLGNSQTATSALPIQDPLLRRDAYPAPGAAHLHYTNKLGGTS